ncbi:TIGR03826 family flagellar region protein [Ornithinibacillus californiensis]|uniref:TIGR03826 family flagellar region protein n=1 Tax=Ornithinibacillus californiensis TaxID=161536 RepID=UPI00064DE23F|nr:TIGR03826 family flagellar region protein [Ornithinibacillus californiensis]
MAEIANCTRCGNVFVKELRDICRDCYKEEEAAFKKVYEFLKQQKNRQATLIEVVEATGVDETQVTKFIKEKRLRTSMFPKLGYPCERCGTIIATGKLCLNCSDEIHNELNKLEEIEKVAERNKEKKPKPNTYYAINKHRR